MANEETFFCPDCGNPFKQAQFEAMQRGEKIVCEKCGKKIQIAPSPKSKSTTKAEPVKLFDFKKIGQNIQANMKKNADQAKNFFQGLAPKILNRPNQIPLQLDYQFKIR